MSKASILLEAIESLDKAVYQLSHTNTDMMDITTGEVGDLEKAKDILIRELKANL